MYLGKHRPSCKPTDSNKPYYPAADNGRIYGLYSSKRQRSLSHLHALDKSGDRHQSSAWPPDTIPDKRKGSSFAHGYAPTKASGHCPRLSPKPFETPSRNGEHRPRCDTPYLIYNRPIGACPHRRASRNKRQSERSANRRFGRYTIYPRPVTSIGHDTSASLPPLSRSRNPATIDNKAHCPAAPPNNTSPAASPRDSSRAMNKPQDRTRAKSTRAKCLSTKKSEMFAWTYPIFTNQRSMFRLADEKFTPTLRSLRPSRAKGSA